MLAICLSSEASNSSLYFSKPLSENGINAVKMHVPSNLLSHAKQLLFPPFLKCVL